MFFHMVYKSGQIFLPFCHNPRVWRTDGQTDGRTDRQTEFSSLDRVCIPCSAVIKPLVSAPYPAGGSGCCPWCLSPPPPSGNAAPLVGVPPSATTAKGWKLLRSSDKSWRFQITVYHIKTFGMHVTSLKIGIIKFRTTGIPL